MAELTPNNLAFAADGQFVVGGSVAFGFENVVPVPEDPLTLKGIFIDADLTAPATNPQPLDSDGKYEQSATGILYGTGAYSVRVFNAAGVQVAYNSSYSPSIGTAAGFEVGTDQNEIPLNSDLGSSSTVDTGTGDDEIPLNSDLGTASTKDTGTATGNVLLSESAGLNNGETNWTSGNFSKPSVGGGITGIDVNNNATQNLPAGGTFFVFYQQIDNSGNFLNTVVDILAGGTTIFRAFR